MEALHIEAKDIENRLDKAVESIMNAKQLSMDIVPGFAEIPVLEMVRGIREGISLSLETVDRLSRFAVLQKTVTIKADGKDLGPAFCRASIEDPWDMHDVFKKYPFALQFLFNVCEDYVLKKLMPPQRDTPEVTAGTDKGSAQP